MELTIQSTVLALFFPGTFSHNSNSTPVLRYHMPYGESKAATRQPSSFLKGLAQPGCRSVHSFLEISNTGTKFHLSDQ